MTVRVVTDSAGDIPQPLAEELGITVVPLVLIIDDEELRDGVDIDSDGFFVRLAAASDMPSTAQPAAGVFVEVYQGLIDDGATGIISVHIAGELSGTIESARQAAATFDTGVPIVHIDSQSASLGEGVVAIEVARALGRGASLEDAVAVGRDVIRRSHLFLTVDTLEYLRRGGRLGRGQELFGSMLQIKPILEIKDGALEVLARVRRRRKSLNELTARASEFLPGAIVAGVHGAAQDDLETVLAPLIEQSPDAEVMRGQISPVIGVHGGPGTLGVGVVTPPDEDSPSAATP
jgi:DegV family protein with EDD domain